MGYDRWSAEHLPDVDAAEGRAREVNNPNEQTPRRNGRG